MEHFSAETKSIKCKSQLSVLSTRIIVVNRPHQQPQSRNSHLDFIGINCWCQSPNLVFCSFTSNSPPLTRRYFSATSFTAISIGTLTVLTDRKGSKNPYTGKLHVRPRPNVELFMRRTKLLNLGRPKLSQDRLLPGLY